jgi:hypothetical protein
MRAFILSNRLVASFLELAAALTPQALNSIVLLHCRKKPDERPRRAGRPTQRHLVNVRAP